MPERVEIERLQTVKARALLSLARLASKALHRAYIDGATVDQYLLPDELVNDVDSSHIWMTHPANRAQFSDREIERFASVLAVIDAKYDEAESQLAWETRGPVAEIEAWSEIQRSASDALFAFGIDAASLSLEQLEDAEAWTSTAQWDIP